MRRALVSLVLAVVVAALTPAAARSIDIAGVGSALPLPSGPGLRAGVGVVDFSWHVGAGSGQHGSDGNGLANALPLNGQTTAAVSDSFPVYFVPAGYVFAIWGVIYLALIAYTIFQALPAQRANPTLRRIGWLYILSAAANSAWIFFWHYELFPLTVPAIAAGSIFTFSLTLGDYIVPGLVSTTQFIGNVIFVNVAQNLPLAAAYSLVPLAIMLIYLFVVRRFGAFDAL